LAAGHVTLYVDGVEVGGKGRGDRSYDLLRRGHLRRRPGKRRPRRRRLLGANTFTGEVNWVEIDVGKAAEDADHRIDPDELFRVAMA
jgi:hypothetical protein